MKPKNVMGCCIYRRPESVNCNDHSQCEHCGWNPVVEEKRKAQEERKRRPRPWLIRVE